MFIHSKAWESQQAVSEQLILLHAAKCSLRDKVAFAGWILCNGGTKCHECYIMLPVNKCHECYIMLSVNKCHECCIMLSVNKLDC